VKGGKKVGVKKKKKKTGEQQGCSLKKRKWAEKGGSARAMELTGGVGAANEMEVE